MNGWKDGSVNPLIDAHVYGTRSDWEKHDVAGQARFVKPIQTQDAVMKARIANRYAELGFVPSFFKAEGQEFVALEVTHASHYTDVEEAFVTQILARL